jgi:sRNA-binding protein
VTISEELAMAKQRSSFAKLQRDKAKKERAAMKRANRQQRKAEAEAEAENPTAATDEDGELVPGEGELSAPELLALIEDLHKRREAGTISLEDFEEAKVELFARLPVD